MCYETVSIFICNSFVRKMKNSLIIFSLLAAIFVSGYTSNSQRAELVEKEESAQVLSREEIQSRSFDELFKQIDPTEIPDDVFKLVGTDFTVITSGDADLYNSMVASWGGWGIIFNKPTTWCFLRANRYTLEVIRDKHTYTMSYFDDEYKDDIMLFGTKSGRDSDKMKECQLTSVETPSGNRTYKEAKLIIECQLTQITTVSPDDFYSEEGRDLVTKLCFWIISF